LLLFSALFSAIVATFLSISIGDLQPDYAQMSTLLLFGMTTNQTIPGSDPTEPFSPPAIAIAVNCLWISSLMFSLFASVCAMLCKQWVVEYSNTVEPVVQLLRACQRHARFMAIDRWRVRSFVVLVPTLIQLSFLFFFFGMIVYLWPICWPVAGVMCLLAGSTSAVYLCVVLLPLFTLAPFHTSTTTFLYYILHPTFQFLLLVVNGFGQLFVAIAQFFVSGLAMPLCQVLKVMHALWNEVVEVMLRRLRKFLSATFHPIRRQWSMSQADNISLDMWDQALSWLIH